MNFLKNLYNNSPLWLKNIYSSIPYEIRNGKEYRIWSNFLKQNLNHEEYELLKIKETLAYSYKNVPYYTRTFNELGMVPEDVNDKKDLSLLPLIDKSIIRENFEELQAGKVLWSKRFYVTTGGTSGFQHKFYQSNNVWKKELAFIINYLKSFGYDQKNIRASFRGGEFSNLPDRIYWKMSPINNEVSFSPFHINSNTVRLYVEKLNEIRPQFINGYPSALLLLIRNIQAQNLRLAYQPKVVLLTSENFTIQQTDEIRNFFNCTITTFYGHSERLIFAPAEADLNIFSVDRRYGCFELVDDQGKAIRVNNAPGEIVGTGFDNYAMPLIRYRTDDLTSFVDYSCLRVTQIKGRWNQEFLDGRDLLKVSVTGLNMHSDIFQNILAMQFYQPRAGEAVLIIVTKDTFTESDARKILQAFNKKAGHAIKFSLERRESLIQTERGKAKLIIKDYPSVTANSN
ncbi:MAG: hypothetical protein ACM3S2_12325 [Ignavibacteriales bacterium]